MGCDVEGDQDVDCPSRVGGRWLQVAGAAALLLGGCAAPARMPPKSSVESVSAQPSYTPMAFGPAERRAARQVATATMRTYARPGRDPHTWWDALRPHLSAAAQTAYAGTDPAVILARRLTGPAVLTPASLPALARVAVPTDAGSYLLLLSRSPGQPWVVERITPPEAEVR